ncbi:UNVERIFIED_CONTAM: hypothetical protein BEN50_22815 [Euhalothece sp. KZN 001]
MKPLTIISLFLIAIPSPVFAQVVSDRSTSTVINQVETNQFEITGGEQAGGNLFHSFEQFSLPQNGSIQFLNTNAIQNIISRVTGESPSNIQGSIATAGEANLILLNPNGITFGNSATLQIGGSFMATTAEQIKFADGTIYHTKPTNEPPLLTVTAPIGLGFGVNPKSIINLAGGIDPTQNNRSVEGLEIPSEETFAFIGGKIVLEEGIIKAPGGRVELGAVGDNSEVKITETESGWRLNYDQVKTFSDLQFLNNSLVSISDVDPNFTTDSIVATSSSAQLQGKQIIFDDTSNFAALNFDTLPSQPIFIHATESLIIRNQSAIVNTSQEALSDAGNIVIDTAILKVLNSSRITSNTQISDGEGGEIIINARDQVTLDEVSVISTETFGAGANFPNGKAGNINVNTRNLEITNGSRIVSSVREGSIKNGGTIQVNATESIRINGSQDNNFTQEIQFSRIASEATTRDLSTESVFLTTGNAGKIDITTDHLNLSNGGQISVAVRNAARGKAGILSLDVDRVRISGENSGIFSSSVSKEDAGNLTINASSVLIQQGGEISATTTGNGDAGNLIIDANLLQLQQGEISANTQGGKGNIFLSAEDLRLRDNSKIETNAFGFADGGNINLNTDTLTLLETSQISANAQQGFGGAVVVNTQGLFISPESSITATSERGEAFNGVIEINTPEQSNIEVMTLNEQANSEPQVYQQCRSNESQSQLIVSGRGGLANTPQDIRSNHGVEADLTLPNHAIEAQGWVINEQGKTVLTANSPFAFQSACLQLSD